MSFSEGLLSVTVRYRPQREVLIFVRAPRFSVVRHLCGTAPRPSVPVKNTPTIVLDTGYMGHEVVIVKNGVRICGTGGALGSVPILQNKAFFEVKLQQSGVWGVGIATRNANMNKVRLGEDSHSWVLCSDGSVQHNGEEKFKVADMPAEGDIIGVSYDHVELNFYINGKPTNTPVTGCKGTVYPVLYVDDGAIMDIIFDNFSYGPPPGYDGIMIEKSLLEND